jgi:hypothetical protein
MLCRATEGLKVLKKRLFLTKFSFCLWVSGPRPGGFGTTARQERREMLLNNSFENVRAYLVGGKTSALNQAVMEGYGADLQVAPRNRRFDGGGV